MDVTPETADTIGVVVTGLSGLLFAGLGLPLARKKIKPNSLYGFRTKKTLSDPDIWYAANKVTGIDMILSGIVLVIAALVMQLAGASIYGVGYGLHVCLAVFVVVMVGLLAHSSYVVYKKL